MSQKYKTVVLKLIPKVGTFNSPSFIIDGSNVMCSLVYSGLESDTIEAKLLQSVDDINFGIVPDSNIVIDKRLGSHTWNVRGLVRGCFLKVSIVIPTGTVPEGLFETINLLSHA